MYVGAEGLIKGSIESDCQEQEGATQQAGQPGGGKVLEVKPRGTPSPPLLFFIFAQGVIKLSR